MRSRRGRKVQDQGEELKVVRSSEGAKQSMGQKRLPSHSLLPGTRMKIRHRMTSMMMNVKKLMSPLLSSNDLTYGSVMRLKFIKVYSDRPTKARMGSSIHS
jgi:hypothetical protein